MIVLTTHITGFDAGTWEFNLGLLKLGRTMEKNNPLATSATWEPYGPMKNRGTSLVHYLLYLLVESCSNSPTKKKKHRPWQIGLGR